MVSHVLKIDPTYPKQVREEEEEWGTREQSSGSRSSELILAQARKSRIFKISDLTLSLRRESSSIAQVFTLPRDPFSLRRESLAQARISKEEIERDILSAGYLTLEDRLVHYFLTYVILPKFSNHSQISDIELQLMYAIKYNIKINRTKMITQQMWHVRGSQSPLPYAIFITEILEHFGVSLDGETKVALNLRKSKVDIEVVHNMGFVIDHITRRTYKHRTDRQTAPTDKPEPTAPNQPESHATSTAMPTNQMIMNELVSLRGYITTRMDAFDTQSQQIHYELHRLSSRLSNMDVDEDSSEPEHITPKETGSILKTSQDTPSSMLLSENYTFKKILVCHHQKRGDCEEDLAPDLGTVLMKTTTSQKGERKKTYKDYRRQSFKELESKS
ncbi:hypothetical protein Lal_00039752 [Lupinus albus]|nr:hypothetical protein Lal_00039752 [Lupinus albus]